MKLWPQSIALDWNVEPKAPVLGDNLAAKENASVVAAQLGRFAASGRISWHQNCRGPPDFRALSSQLIVKRDGARMTRGQANLAYGLNGALTDPYVDSRVFWARFCASCLHRGLFGRF